MLFSRFKFNIQCCSHLVRRRLATATTPGEGTKLSLTFVSPHQTILKDTKVEQVNLCTTDGELGVLANHVPSIMQLVPGLVEVFQQNNGGFAMVNPDSTMEISALEVIPMEHLDASAITQGLVENQKRVSKDDSEKAEIEIHHQVYSAMNYALQKSGTKG